MGKPGGENPGLAGAGAGEDQHRSLDGLDRPELHFIELGEIGARRRRARDLKRRTTAVEANSEKSFIHLV